MIVKWWFVCIITAMVSSKGDIINVNNLQRVEQTETHCLIYQYYNPYVIKSDWTCEQVSHAIADAIIMGCKENS